MPPVAVSSHAQDKDQRSKGKTVAGTSEAFDVKVGVHQRSAPSPLLFIIVMEEVTKLARGDGPWELLYADDLVLTAESREEVTDMINRWKEEMEQRGLKINTEKTKLMVTGNMAREGIQSGRWPCGCCERGVGSTSMLCMNCNKWCHHLLQFIHNMEFDPTPLPQHSQGHLPD